EGLLGPAHIELHSGGEWLNEATGELEPKRHLYWILRQPAESSEDLAKLTEAQKIAIALVDGDSSLTLVHPLRCPGAWHRKGKARLCTMPSFNGGAEIELNATLAILRQAFNEASPEVKARFSKAKGNGKANGFDAHATDYLRTLQDRWGNLIANVISGTDYHDSINVLAMKLQKAGTDDRAVRNLLCGWMEQT